MRSLHVHWLSVLLGVVLGVNWPVLASQAPSASSNPSPGPVAADRTAGRVTSSQEYVIGPDDVLSIVFWREKDLSTEAVVRPDGNISVPLLNDVFAAGLTPDQLRVILTKAAERFVATPSVTVVVRTINSRKVFVTGNVIRPGAYPLSGPMDVLQVIAIAGGLTEFADAKHITVMRSDNGRPQAHKFNYRDVAQGKNLSQNIAIKPGDTVVVP